MNKPSNPFATAAFTSLAALATAALLAGCFGGGGDDDPPAGGAVTEVPASAVGSASAYTQFVLTLANSASETAEPLSAGALEVPPASETDEPVPAA